MMKDDKCLWVTTTEDGGQNILRSSSMGYSRELHDDDDDDNDDDSMMMVVVVVREDASIFINHRR